MDPTGKSNAAGASNNVERPAKGFLCKHNGCDRRFTRLEHLNRHALNHTAGDATCSRCRAHFKRPDLLARHMDRHRQKDEESGGNGVLKTRKRSWKQVDGSIVEKRPDSEPVDAENRSDSLVTSNPAPAIQGPISPPVSQQSSDIAASDHHLESPYHDFSLNLEQDEVAPTSIFSLASNYISVADTAPDTFRNSTFPQFGQGIQNSPDIFYDEVFQADTASSFNMPYTTATNYNWLFDLNDTLQMNSQQPQQPLDQRLSIQGLGEPREGGRTINGIAEGSSQSFSHSEESSIYGSQPSSFNDGAVPSATSRTRSSILETNHGIRSSIHQQSPLGNPSLGVKYLERPLSTLQRPSTLPCIDDCTREAVLALIESLQPISPEQEPITHSSRLLSLTALQGYLDIFFMRFNTAYPLIHQPTFVASNVDTLLLLSMLLLGATYSSKGAHRVAVCIHDVMRPAIFSHAAFSEKPQLWVLETILLTECFGKSRAGQKQHDMSHLFHGLLINLIRRSDCQTVQPIGPEAADYDDQDLETVWQQWAEAEQKKRLALLCFLWDTQHAVLFCQSLCMSSFELRLSLPSCQSLWEAQTASEWKNHAANYSREPPFLTTLKSYLTPSSPRPQNLDCLSRVLILHGLMSIFWDMQRRNQTSLGVVPGENGSGLGAWRDRLAQAYDIWKTEFDAHVAHLSSVYDEVTSLNTSPSPQDARQELATFSMSYRAIYHAAQILLHSEFLDVQIYAGARHILGKPVQRNDYVRSERIVKQWAASSVSSHQSLSPAKAAWHAATMLHDASESLINFDSMGLFHVPWCLYLATLTCWAFHHTGHPGSGDGRVSNGEMVWDAKADMAALLMSMAGSGNPREVALRQGRERTEGLVWVMANVLEKVRWGIIHAGAVVLRGLVPWRLINQYEMA